MNSIICVTTGLPFDGAVVGGKESLVFTIQIRMPRQRGQRCCSYYPIYAIISVNVIVIDFLLDICLLSLESTNSVQMCENQSNRET